MRRLSSKILLILCLLLSGCSTLQLGMDKNQPVRKITPFGANSAGPFWAPSGTELVASRLVYPKNDSQIYRFDVDGQNKKLLLETNGSVDAQAISADGNKLLFASFGSDDFKRGIWIMDLTLKKSSFIGPGDAANWAPDEKQLAVFTCKDNSKLEIKVYDLQSSEETTLFEQNGPCYGPNSLLAWSPNGRTLAFSYDTVSSMEEPDPHIYLFDFNTMSVESEIGNLSSTISWSPSWSPDSMYLVYTIPTSDQLAIYDTLKKCTNMIDLINVPYLGSVSWSPDGSKWAISGGGQMYIVDIEKLLGKDYFTTSICE
jgi:Tol biopolymer transport system component